MSYEIRSMRPEDAGAAADLHIEGQPDTFLTSLGRSFLVALYSQMALSPHCFGYVAVDGDEVIGVVTGTVDSGAVFKELVLRRGVKLALPVLGSILRRPSLIPRVVETLLYPSQTEVAPGEAEMLYLAARADRRGEGIGRALYWAFVEGLWERGYQRMGLCVDTGNEQAVRFHERQGMDCEREFTMYGRLFRWYVLPRMAYHPTDARPPRGGTPSEGAKGERSDARSQ